MHVQHVPRAGRSSQEGTESRGREGSPGMPVFCHRAATTAVTKHEALAARGSLINRRAGGEQRAAQPMRSHGRETSSATSPRSLLASLTKKPGPLGPYRTGLDSTSSLDLPGATQKEAEGFGTRPVHSKNYFYWKRFAPTKRVKNRCKTPSKKKGLLSEQAPSPRPEERSGTAARSQLGFGMGSRRTPLSKRPLGQDKAQPHSSEPSGAHPKPGAQLFGGCLSL